MKGGGLLKDLVDPAHELDVNPVFFVRHHNVITRHHSPLTASCPPTHSSLRPSPPKISNIVEMARGEGEGGGCKTYGDLLVIWLLGIEIHPNFE